MRHLLALALAAFPLAAFAEDVGQVVAQPPLAEFVAAFPRVSGETDAAKAINARLQELDDGVAEMLDCDLNRAVKVSLDSAAYLSLYANEGGYCEGAAHPYFIEFGLTFDRATGKEVDWAALLPEKLLERQSEDYSEYAPFGSKALNATYLAGLDPELAGGECKEVYDMGLNFQFWLAAGKGLAMAPADLPHAVTACAEIVYLTPDALRAVGADAALIEALETGTGDATTGEE